MVRYNAPYDAVQHNPRESHSHPGRCQSLYTNLQRLPLNSLSLLGEGRGEGKVTVFNLTAGTSRTPQHRQPE